MADLQFTPTSTPSQTTDRGWVTARDPMWCRAVLDPEPDLGPAGLSAPVDVYSVLPPRWWGHTDSRHAHTTHITIPSKQIPMGLVGIKDGRLRGKREECWNEAKRKSCFTERDLQLHLLLSQSSHMCPFLRKKQSEFWHSSNSRHVLLSAFLTTLIWHSHITNLWICHLASRNYSSCESDVTGRRVSAPSLPGSSARGGAPVSE